jgi:glucosamine 6-phosphate synthetase-like amidotransferase/phosphosugar isomerase protein
MGATYYVGLFGQYVIATLVGEFAPALSSNEAGKLALMDPETLVLAISQSGETFDTLQVLRQAGSCQFLAQRRGRAGVRKKPRSELPPGNILDREDDDGRCL